MEISDVAINALYHLLAALGFPEPTLNKKGLPTIAWPETKTGISMGSEKVPRGWDVVVIGPELKVLSELFTQLGVLGVKHQLRTSAGGATRNISSDEQTLLDALLRAGLPVPDRNYKVVDDDGTFRGVLDFAWDAIEGKPVKVAIELDGWYWHGGADVAKEIASWFPEEASIAKTVDEEERARGARDAGKRRIMVERGWSMVTVHDTEIRDGKAPEIAEGIRSLISRRYLEAQDTLPPVLSATALEGVD